MSAKANTGEARLYLIVFLFFFLVGLSLFIISIGLTKKLLHLQNWKKVPVTNYQLASIDDDSVEISYSYTYKEKQYKAFDTIDTLSQALELKKSKLSYGFVNPANPSESLLVINNFHGIDILLPVSLLFMLVGVSVVGGSIKAAWERRKAHILFRTQQQICPNRLKAYIPFIMFLSISWFVLALLPILLFVIFLILGISPNYTWLLFLNVGLILLSVVLGWLLRFRPLAPPPLSLQILTSAGTHRPMEVLLSLAEKSKRKIDDFKALKLKFEFSAQWDPEGQKDILSDIFQDDPGDKTVKVIKLSSPFKQKTTYTERSLHFILDPHHIYISQPEDSFIRGVNVETMIPNVKSRFLEEEGYQEYYIKKNKEYKVEEDEEFQEYCKRHGLDAEEEYREYYKHIATEEEEEYQVDPSDPQIAQKMAAVLQGGSQAREAASGVKKYLETKGSQISVVFILTLLDQGRKKELRFPLPLQFWNVE